jgi:hypothetical protein
VTTTTFEVPLVTPVTSVVSTTTGTVVVIYAGQQVVGTSTYVNYNPALGTSNVLYTPPATANGPWSVGSQALYVLFTSVFYIYS